MSILVAHRGFRSLAGENRLIDFQVGLKFCSAVEFDIRLTKDYQVIIFHDDDFQRIAQCQQRVNSLTLPEIKTLPFFQSNNQSVPLLLWEFSQQLAQQYQMINVEIKAEPNRSYTKHELDLLFQAIADLQKNTTAEIIISSFNQQLLDEIESRKSFPYKTGYLFTKKTDFDYLRAQRFDYLHPGLEIVLDTEMIPILKKLKKPLNVWTFQKNAIAKTVCQIYQSQIYGYISDNPTLSWL